MILYRIFPYISISKIRIADQSRTWRISWKTLTGWMWCWTAWVSRHVSAEIFWRCVDRKLFTGSPWNVLLNMSLNNLNLMNLSIAANLSLQFTEYHWRILKTRKKNGCFWFWYILIHPTHKTETWPARQVPCLYNLRPRWLHRSIPGIAQTWRTVHGDRQARCLRSGDPGDPGDPDGFSLPVTDPWCW